MSTSCALQDLQAQLCLEQQASARSETELQAVHRQRQHLEAQLVEAQKPVADTRPSDFQGSQLPLMLPAPADHQVGPVPQCSPYSVCPMV